MVLHELYETQYGIYNHLDKSRSRPLASVAFHDCEDVNKYSLLDEKIKLYISRGLRDIYGLNLLEFLELPVDIVDMLISNAEEHMTKKKSILREVEKELKSQ